MKRWILIMLSSPMPLAIASEGSADLREQCRASISGIYLSYMNDLDVLKNHLQASNESSFALKAQRTLSTSELKALEAKNEKQKTPAAELDEELLGLRDRLASTHDSILESDSRVATIKDQIAGKEKEFKKFHESLKPVFAIATAKVVNRGAYPIRLEYRHSCDRFQQLCPLPKAEAEVLVKLSKSLDDPTPCIRYAEIR